MAHTLKNDKLEIKIDFPLENYHFSRFDRSGKIVGVKYKNIELAGVEDPNCAHEDFFGKGFYNEFGIDTPLGFDKAEIGGWFHKIGVGLLKKEGAQYVFHKQYDINPLEFETKAEKDSVLMSCISPLVNGYAYELRKEIALQASGFRINYHLKNTGVKAILTDEYVHNFIAINKDLIGKNYSLNFPFKLEPELFGERVNPDSTVVFGGNQIGFNSTPNEQFFFSNLGGGKSVEAAWELLHRKTKIGIREITDFQTSKINLWGWSHVISPELFFDINIAPDESVKWTRTYEVFEILD